MCIEDCVFFNRNHRRRSNCSLADFQSFVASILTRTKFDRHSFPPYVPCLPIFEQIYRWVYKYNFIRCIWIEYEYDALSSTRIWFYSSQNINDIEIIFHMWRPFLKPKLIIIMIINNFMCSIQNQKIRYPCNFRRYYNNEGNDYILWME